MVQRSYQPVDFGARDSRELLRQQITGTDTRPAVPIQVGEDGWRDKMLSGMLHQGAQVMDKMTDVALSELYMQGAAAAGVVESEDELQGNPLTRDWKVAGYRDTMGKFALADAEAQFLADLPTLREKGPEEFKTYLNARREKLTPALASMSLEARKTVVGQMMMQDRAATKKYTSEHTKFIIDTKAQAVHAQWNTSMQNLKQSDTLWQIGQLPERDYVEQVRGTVATIVGSVWADKTLPTDVKQQLTFEMMQRSLSEDHIGLYDYVQANRMPDGTLEGSTLTSRLNGEQQLKLANSYREAMNRTSDQRSFARFAQIADVEAQIDAGTYTGTRDELLNFLQPMVMNNTIGGNTARSLLNKFYDKAYKGEQQSVLAGMLLKGDVNGIEGMGKSTEDAVKAVKATMAKRALDPAQRLNTWLQIGQSGVEAGYKEAGETLAVSVRQMVDSKDGKVLPQHAETFRTVMASVKRSEDAGYANTRVRLLSGMPEDDRMFVERVIRLTSDGSNTSVEEAVQRAKAEQAKDENLSPAMRAARSSNTSIAVAKAIDAIEPRGILETVWGTIKSAVSTDAAHSLTLSPYSGMNSRDHWMGDSSTVQYYTEQVRSAVSSEAQNIMLLRPSAAADEVISVAKANVAARTIETRHGPLVLPRGVNLQTTFGVPPGNQAAIGTALDGMLKNTVEDSRFQMTFAQGRLFAQEVDKNGKRVGNGVFVEPQALRARIAEDTAKTQQAADWVFGGGRKVQSKDGTVTFDGMNGAGVPAFWMYGFRENLVAHEGVRSKAYKDLSGNIDQQGNPIMTVGVGVSSTNTFYPKPDEQGNITEQQLNASFRDASDQAAKTGANIARNLNRNNQYGFQLLSELAYQSGPNYMARTDSVGQAYREFGAALQGKDVKAAQDAFKRTAAWRYSGSGNKLTPRQQNYLDLIEKSMK